MEKAKYIIVIEKGHEVPIIFSPLLSHASMAMLRTVVSAGFCEAWGAEPTDINLDTLKVWAGGKSVTLKDSDGKYIESRKEDAEIIRKMLYTC